MAIEFNESEIGSLQKLIHQLLKAHENENYEELLKLSGEDPENPQKPLLTEEEFISACTTLKTKFGVMTSLEYLTTLDKGNMVQSLWKATYDSSPLEILWQIYFMRHGKTLRITGLWFN